MTNNNLRPLIMALLEKLRMRSDQAPTRTRAKAVWLEKFDGDPQPGDKPVEMIEIEYDDAEKIKSRAVHTDPAAIEQCIVRRKAAETGA